MTIPRAALASVFVSMGCSVLAAAGAPADSVVVMRGTDVAAQQSEGVVVMRPIQGSFLRETTRLAAEAEAREERAAADRARYADRRLADAVEALVATAHAMHERIDDDYYDSYILLTPAQPMPGRRNVTLPPVAAPIPPR